MEAPRGRTATWTSRCGAVLAVVLAFAGCSQDEPSPGTADAVTVTGVVLVGDSLAEEASPYLEPMLGRLALTGHNHGGTAPCDWLDQDLEATRDRVVVISFTGNSLTPCMEDPAGGHLDGEALVDRYRVDLTAMVDQVRATGAPVVVVGQPRRGPHAPGGVAGDLEVAGINAIYEDLADRAGVSFVDAGAAVEAPDGTFATTLPCLPSEAECGPGGRNVVRSDDGVHLCPGTAHAPCAVYSSGAFRFARALDGAITDVVEGG